MTHILIIEFDSIIGALLRDRFQTEGFRVTWFRYGKGGYEYAIDNQVDLIILNLMVPIMSGWRILENVRKRKDIPIILLSVENEEKIKIKAFDLGCDDFIAIPFSFRELLGRVKAVLRRSGNPTDSQTQLESGGLRLNISTQTAWWEDHELKLSRLEIEILALLVKNEGQPVHRHKLLDEVWGEDTDVTTRAVDMHIQRLRSKWSFLKKRIHTDYQKGYRWKRDN